MNDLITISKIERMKRDVMQIKGLDEIKQIMDQGVALEAYARSAKLSSKVQIEIAELNMNAKRHFGELSKQLKKGSGGDRKSENQKLEIPTFDKISKINTLNKAGFSKEDAYTAEKIAGIPDKIYNEKLAEAKKEGKKITAAGMLKNGEEWFTPSPFTAEQKKEFEDSDKRVNNFIKTGIKPEKWTEEDEKLLIFKNEMNSEKKERKLQNSKNKEYVKGIGSDLILYVIEQYIAKIENSDFKIIMCNKIVNLCKSLIKQTRM